MRSERENALFSLRLALFIIIELIALVLLWFFFGFKYAISGLVIFLISSIVLIYSNIRHRQSIHQRIVDITKILGKDANEAFDFGRVGLLTYDDQFIITWMSDFFSKRELNFIGEKVTKWLPEVNQIFQGDEEKIIVQYHDSYYEIVRQFDAQLLFFKEITEEHLLENRYQNEQVVLGLIHLDNYEEATQYQEETNISSIDVQIKQPIIDWAISHGMLIKRTKNDRFIVVLNEQIFSTIVEERFSILSDIKQTSESYAIPITLSMAFARGTSDYLQLDEMLNGLLELAQSRGGDQVAMKKFGEDVKYFGGNREAQEKRSKVRVRVISQTLRELILKAHDVIIVGHRESDFDCMGAALGLSRIVDSYHKVSHIICDPDDIEDKLSLTMHRYQEELESRHHFVTEEEALSLLEEDTLVIMVDHYSKAQTNAPRILEHAKNIVVIDHHRRNDDFTFQPLMVYIEAGASSVCELITELFPYQISTVNLTDYEATIMYTGIMIDTGNFKTRTGSRTFEAAAQLRKYGANTIEANDSLKESFEEFYIKTNILKDCERLDNGVVVAAYRGKEILTRAMISQVANDILGIQDVQASFVLGRIAEKTIAISARSLGNINVQVIMEQMNGGGHFTQAGLQREDITMQEIKTELVTVLNEYFRLQEEQDESNSIS